MKLFRLSCILVLKILMVHTIQYAANPTSDVSADEKNLAINKTQDQSDEGSREVEKEEDDTKDKRFLNDAIRTILDPNAVIDKPPFETAEMYKFQLEELDKENYTLEGYMERMDNLSLSICKTSQESLWAYVTDITNDLKKNRMILIAAEEDEIKKQYWNVIKKKYINEIQNITAGPLSRKLRMIKERGTNVQMPQSKQREEIDTMQRIWSRVSICAYGSIDCSTEISTKTMSDIITVFKTSNDSKELAYYWKAYRDSTGKKIRTIFKDYVKRMNAVAQSENFTDAGDMWRYNFEDDNFVETVERLWNDVKPLYELIHNYVKFKLMKYYGKEYNGNTNTIPAHLLGNLWAQEWQSLYPKIAAFPDVIRPPMSMNETISSKELFDTVDEFHQSLGFESSWYSYHDIQESMQTPNCLPSSHDMCDGTHYKIKWCGEKVTDVAVGLSRAARLLGHVQYFKHYRKLSPMFRDGPNPAFHDAISDIVAVQLTSPNYLKSLNLMKMNVTKQVMMNHLLWLALEKIPLMAYAYVLDKWRWTIFSNSSIENWNQYWWELRIKETGISPPMARDESDLDPASKYHVVSHVQYITYLISHILEFQILWSLCKKANYTGPLHECSIYGVTEAGNLLSKGMSLGASESWRTVLKIITNESELSSEGLLKYFEPLKDFLIVENKRLAKELNNDMDPTAPIVVGSLVAILTAVILLLYCLKRFNVGGSVLSVCGLSKNGSLDIAATDLSQDAKTNDSDEIREDKV